MNESRDPPARSAPLSADELAVLRLLAKGEALGPAARRLGMSERTVRRKVRSACAKVGCESTIEAIVWAVRNRQI
jgi:DNA-binding NarL/FixJ family response regulator